MTGAEKTNEERLSQVKYTDENGVIHTIGQVWTTGTLDDSGNFVADGLHKPDRIIGWSLVENAFSQLYNLAKVHKWVEKIKGVQDKTNRIEVEYTGSDPRFVGLKGNLIKLYSTDDTADIDWDNGDYSLRTFFFRTTRE